MLQCVAVCCSVLQCVAVILRNVKYISQFFSMKHILVCCSVLQCVAVCCSVLQCVAVILRNVNYFSQFFSMKHILMCCSVLQCVAVCCSVLQCVAVCCSDPSKCKICFIVLFICFIGSVESRTMFHREL